MTHVISMRHEHELRVTTDMLLSIKVLQTPHLHELRLLSLGHSVPTLLVDTHDIANDPATRQVHARRRGDRKHLVQGALLQHAQVMAERQEAWNLGVQHWPARVDGRRLHARHCMKDAVVITVYKDAADGARLLRMKHCHKTGVFRVLLMCC